MQGVVQNFIEYEAVTGGQFALQGIEEFLPNCLQSPVGQLEYYLRRLPGYDRLPSDS